MYNMYLYTCILINFIIYSGFIQKDLIFGVFFVIGECNCLDGFYGSSCSLDPTQPPQIGKLAFEGLCDSTKRPCEKFRIPGTDFINGSLTCKFRSFSVSLQLMLFRFHNKHC